MKWEQLPKCKKIALEVKPYKITIVPERREEKTTESGLNIKKYKNHIKEYIKPFLDKGIKPFLFLDPNLDDIEIAKEVGAYGIELHTGTYSEVFYESEEKTKEELEKLTRAAEYANSLGLLVCAGHGLDYKNIYPILRLPYLYEVSIGFSIIAKAVFVGLEQAILEMKNIIKLNF